MGDRYKAVEKQTIISSQALHFLEAVGRISPMELYTVKARYDEISRQRKGSNSCSASHVCREYGILRFAMNVDGSEPPASLDTAQFRYEMYEGRGRGAI